MELSHLPLSALHLLLGTPDGLIARLLHILELKRDLIVQQLLSAAVFPVNTMSR